jgi:glycosyltransferase involved in cell wall biosynthesis
MTECLRIAQVAPPDLPVGPDTERLRIAQVAPLDLPVGPDSGGSIHQLIWLITEELVRLGHAVTLFASGDSQTSATLHAVYPRDYHHDESIWDWRFHELLHVASAFEHAREFDVIHSHVYHLGLPFTRLVGTPVVHTYHIDPDEDVVRGFARYPEARVVAISHYQRRLLEALGEVEVVHHGIDTGAFPFCPERGEYLVFLGRIIPRKGPVEAIRLARRVGMPLVMAGPAEAWYYHPEVAPLVDGDQIRYIGPVAAADRAGLLGRAAALLFPVTAGEPFGLVTVEAMACGTPVAALARGAVAEIIENGVTGYYADDPDALAALIPATVALDRERVRREVVRRFDYRRMVRDYVDVYRRAAARGGRRTA